MGDNVEITTRRSTVPPEHIHEQRILTFDSDGAFDPPERTQGLHAAFSGNRIQTSVYTPWNFIPLNLFKQISRPANFYYCLIAILQAVPQVSNSQGKPTILVPLLVIFAATAIKDFLEDSKRHKEDNEENKRQVEVVRWDGKLQSIQSEDIKVGDILRIRDGQRFPADLMLITSAKGRKGPYCWVETSNIDGETNLKLKQSPEGFNSLVSFDGFESARGTLRATTGEVSIDAFKELKKRLGGLEVSVDRPNAELDHWHGMVKNMRIPIYDDENTTTKKENKDGNSYDSKNVVVSIENLLLRGSELRNSDWIYGLVVYTGFDCKIFMNNQSRHMLPLKRSSVERQLNRYVYAMAATQLFLCILCAILSGQWIAANPGAWYLDNSQDPAFSAFTKFFTWFIIFSQLIPISLVVSMEMVKYMQAFFMQWDIKMHARLFGKEDKFCNVQNSALNEELGQIEYVFSDKTGTLTENSLDFRKCFIGTENFGQGETEIIRAAKRREEELSRSSITKGNTSNNNTNSRIGIKRQYSAEQTSNPQSHALHVNFDESDRLFMLLSEALQLGEKASQQAQLARRFLTILALNNSCFPIRDEFTHELSIRAASPDDECLTCFANYMGVKLVERNPPRVELSLGGDVEDEKSQLESWEQLAELEFTSKRKRMTVILKNNKTGKIHITMKGADSEMVKCIAQQEKNPNWKLSEKYLNQYSEEGLRTLVIAEAIVNSSWWDDPKTGWRGKYLLNQEETLIGTPAEKGHMKGSCSDECRICTFYEQLEMHAELELVGVTAIEDKLQVSVPETITALLDAQIKVWMLTGDKQKTAENIGAACNLLEPAMERDGFLFRLLVDDRAQLFQLMDEAVNKIKKEKTEQQNAAMVVNSTAVHEIMSKKEDQYDLLGKFLELSQLCKSVIGVRLQPNQKAQVVDFIKRTTQSITLAIGDGSNDEPMIRVANVGVGIAGLEGTAAVRASDYAIAKFKFLKRLLFVHGRQNYRRVTVLIGYMFYKNSLLSFSAFWFGWLSAFSAQTIFLDWAFQMYNVVFTAFPILLYAVVDRDYPDDVLLMNPRWYARTLKGKLFKWQKFIVWIIDAILASFFLTMLSYWFFLDVTSIDSSGQSQGIWSFGLTNLTGIIFCANLRLAFLTTSWSKWMHLLTWGSLVAFFLGIIMLNSSSIYATAGVDYYWVFYRLLGTARFWLTVFLIVIVGLFLPFSYEMLIQLRKRGRHGEPTDALYTIDPPLHSK